MAKRNQVTADLRISANAQLKNSQSFIKELERITSGFDFGNKINNQLEIAKGQLKEYNKVLSKVQNKSVVSDEELKDIVKAGKEIASLVTKTQSLYKNLNGGDLKKYSREYIAETKRIEQEVAKIKQDYTNKTGKNFDKELANYDKLLAKNKELKKQREQIAKSGVEELVAKQIEQTTQKLEQQKKKLEEIKALREQSSKTYSNTLNQEAAKRGYKDYNDLNSRKVLNEDQIKKNIGTNIYKQERQELAAISKELKNIESIKDNIEAQNKKVITLAAKYNIENVKDLNTLKAQVKARQDLLNSYKNDKSKLALRNQELITEEIRKQNQLAKDKTEVKDAAKTAELNVITAGGYNSKASLSASYATTNKSVNNLSSQLTESGIETITNNATTQIKSILQTIDNDIRNSNGDLSSIDETNKKLATQSERAADEQDIKDGTATTANNLENNKKDINDVTTQSSQKVIQLIQTQASLKEFRKTKDYNGIINGFDNLTNPDYDIESSKKQMEVALERATASLNGFLGGGVDQQRLEQEFNSLESIIIQYRKALEEELEYRKNIMDKSIAAIEKDGRLKPETKQERIQDEFISFQNDKDKFELENFMPLQTLEAQVKAVTNVTNATKNSSKAQEDHANVTKREADNLALAAEQSSYLGSTFDDIRNKIGYFLSLNYVFDQITRKITEAVQVTKEMDRDMTQIGLVLGKTSGQVWKNFDTYSKMAERLNTTTSQVTNSMKLFYQQGLNTSEVNKMVEASAIAAALGESTMAEASETLTSIINSYNLSANEAMTVTDKISQIAIVSAADFGELSTAIEKVASSAASAGLDLDHMMGYLGKMIETTREAPTNIGTALKTIVANFTQFKEDPTGLNEEGTEINKVDKALKSVGISLTDTNGEVRDLSEVLDELGGIWDTLNRNQKSYLATAIAGTRQQSRFYALMNDYERTLELVAEGSNSAGKAQQQFGLYTDSLEAATNRLTNQWEKFFNSITRGNGVIKITTDVLTNLMKIINTIGPLGSALGLTSFVIQLRKGINEFNNFSNGVNKLKDDKDSFDFFSNIKQSIDANKTDKNLTQEQKVDNIRILNKQAQNYATNNQLPNLLNNFNDVEKIIKIQDEIDTLNTKISIESDLFTKLKLKGTKALESIKLGATKGKIAITAMGKAIGTAMLQMIAIFAVTKIIEGLIKVVDLATTSSEELKESMTQHQDNATTIDGLKKEYEELAKKVNKTAEEQERLKEITEEVTKIDAALGNQLKNNEKAYQSNIKAMEEYSKLQKELAAQDAAKAIKKENGFWSSFGDSSIFGEGYWADLKAIFGDTTEQKTLKNERFNQWRNLANARGVENNLSDNEAEMLNNYIEELISKNQYLDAEQIKAKTGQLDKKISEYIESLKNMTKAQKDEYEALKQYGINDDNSLNSFYDKIEESSLDESTKNQMKNNLLNTARDVYYGQLKPNYFINDVDRVFSNLMDNLSQEKLGQLFNRDLSSLDENEKINYQKDMAELFSNENIDTFISKFKIGGEAFDNYINSLKDSGKITDSTAEVLVGLKESANIASKALSSLEKFENIINSTLREGKLSQMDILKKIISDEAKMGDIQIHKTGISQNTTGGTGLGYQTSFMTIDTKSIVASAMQEIKNSLAPIKDRQTSLEGKYSQYQNIPQTGIDDARKRQEAAQNKVNDLQNKLKEAQNNLEDKRGDYLVRDSMGGLLTPIRGVYDLVNAVKGKDVVGDFEGAQQEVKNYQKQLEEAQEELKNTTEETKNAEQAAKNLTDETTEVGKAFKEEGEYLKEQTEQAKDTYDALEQLAQLQIKPMADFSAVFDQFQVMGQVDQQLNSLQQAWDMATSGAQNYRDVAALIAQDPSLINAIDMESEHLQFSDEALEAHAKNVLQTEMKSVDSKIKGTEAIIACLEGQTGSSDAWKTATNEDIASAMAYNSSWVKSEQDSTDSTKTELENSSEQYATWGNSVQEAYRAVEAARVAYIKGLNSESETNYLTSIKNLKGVSLTGSTSELPNVNKTDVEATKNQILGDAAGNDEKTKEIINKYKTQLSILQKLKNDLQADINNPRGLFKRNSSNSGGGKDKFDAMVEKLEHFYNYLRQIEALEAKINKIREKRNLIDATQNYYIKDLAEENKLLKEQASLYGRYINDEVSYLADLRSQLAAAYGDWVYFNDEGVVQVKQTEFNINSEAEQERYEAFSELLDEYQNEYNTMLENQNKLYSIQATIVENINNSYDKVLQKLNDVTERLEYINSISEHRVNMEFGSIKKLKIMNDQIKTTADMLLYAQKSVNELEGDFNQLSKIVEESAFKSLLTWDETLQKYFVNNDALNNDNIKKQFESQGYNWEEIVTWVNATAGASQKITDSMQEANEQLMSARESLKDLLDERLSTIDEIFDKATEEINKFYGIYEKKIASLGTENDLFGTKSENLEKQFDYLVTTAQHAKALLNDLKENNQSILDTLMKDYGQYVDMIDGVAYINKIAIEESNTLTEGQKADLLQLYQLYYDSKDQIDEVNDKFYDYISQIKEMEETKRDAIIDLKNQLYQELLRIDQKEIDDLQEKYQKMNQLDSEYYSKLQQRINDARNARSRLQEQQNLTQMQNRLATLQQDNSGQYNSEMIELQKQINEQLQSQADQNIDLELERIAREQEQRQEDREMQITQMENLLTFKDENGIYWQETQEIIENGNASVIGKLMESEEIQRMSKEEQAKQFESLESQVETANADFSTIYKEQVGWQTNDIRQGLKDFVEAPLDKIPGEISSSAGQIKEQIVSGTKTFIKTMSALFQYLDELTGKTAAKGYTTGILNDDGTYTAPTKKPDPAPSTPAAPAAPPQSKPSLAKGSYVQVKSGTRWYYDSYGTNPSGRARSGTIKYINTKGSHPYNIEGLGWIKKTDIVGYNKGGYVDYTGIAAVHGKAGKPEAFLNAKQTALFETLRDALAKVPTISSKEENNNSENITIENFTIDVKELADTDSIDKVVKTVKDSIYRDATSGNNMKINRRR